MDAILFNPQTLNPNFPKLIKFPSLKKLASFSIPRRQIPSFIVNCSSLKPKPKPIAEIRETLFDEPAVESTISTNIEKLVFLKKFKEALELFEILQSNTSGNSQGVSASTYDSLVTACIGLRSARDAKFVFRHMMDNGFEFDQYIRNRILLMHLKCGLIVDARRFFDEMPERNIVSWNTIISGFLDLGAFDEPFDLFLMMWSECSDAIGSRSLMNGIRAAAGLNFASSWQDPLTPCNA